MDQPNSMPVKLRSYATRTIYGGPFREAPKEGHYTIKLARELKDRDYPSDFHVPIEDFGVPSGIAIQKIHTGLSNVIDVLADNKLPVYAGCMGGIGRTGLFLSLLAKCLGERDPVGFVREHYLKEAVETAKQKDFIATFDVSEEAHKIEALGALRLIGGTIRGLFR